MSILTQHTACIQALGLRCCQAFVPKDITIQGLEIVLGTKNNEDVTVSTEVLSNYIVMIVDSNIQAKILDEPNALFGMIMQKCLGIRLVVCATRQKVRLLLSGFQT